MATYKFEQFNLEIVDPTINVLHILDSIRSKTCSVDLLLTTDDAEFGITLNGFSYLDTWEDIDIINWVNTEIDKFLV